MPHSTPCQTLNEPDQDPELKNKQDQHPSSLKPPKNPDTLHIPSRKKPNPTFITQAAKTTDTLHQSEFRSRHAGEDV
jgi:hypothetical protein